MALTVIGDVHGKYRQYKELTEKYEYTLQLGDFGFDYGIFEDEEISLDHLFFGGNHDNYSVLLDEDECPPHCLGDFGSTALGGVEFFWIRGGFSIDKRQRIRGISYWDEEELSYKQAQDCLELYKELKPELVISHAAPASITEQFGTYAVGDIIRAFGVDPRGNLTERLLQECLEISPPQAWIFGHFHVSRTKQINGTKFICMNELETLTIEE